MLAVIGLGEWLFLVPVIVPCALLVIWLFRGKSSVRVKMSAVGALVLLGPFLIIYAVDRATPGRGPGISETLIASGPEELAKDRELVIGSSSRQALVFNLERGKALDVSVVEVLGQNIEFAVLQDGRQVFTSGVHSGRATGRVACLPGVVTVSVTNGNIMESKTVRVTVLASSL